jgi:GNAT superfamily N-acetyltransferase
MNAGCLSHGRSGWHVRPPAGHSTAVSIAPYRLSEDPADLDLDRVFAWLSGESYWAKGRPRDVVERSFAGSASCGVYSDRDGQVAVARLVSDGATFAWFCDVYVDAAHRGRGLGDALARWAVQWAERNGVNRLLLGTRDAHEVYRRVGFEPLRHPSLWMEIDHRPQRLES